MRFLHHVLGLAVAFLTILATAAPASSQAPDDPLIHDARQYATTYEVDLDEALRRLRLQAVVGKLDAALTRQEQATYGGLWIQHTPSYLVVVHFTRTGGDNLARYLQAESLGELAPIVERRTVALSLRRLTAIQARAHRIARQQGLRADSQINVMENRVDLLTTAPVELASAIQAAAREDRTAAELRLPDHVAVIGVDRVSEPEAYVYAGLPITFCTSGYSVQSGGGTLGVLTAGHCDNPQQYNNRSLPFQSELFGGSHDVQWHTAPDLFVDNRIHDGLSDATTPLYRFVTGTKSRDEQAIGEFICKHGITTGYTCGTITSKTFNPGYLPDGGNATYIYVSGGSVNLSEGGDSGGPWFSGSVAYGVHNCGGGNDSCYMAIDYASTLGVSVLTTSPQVNVGRWTYRDIGNNVSYYTGIDATVYDCGVAGMAARSGDINENDSGDIIQTYLFKENNHWKIRGDFRTHNNQESWDFDLLCLKKSALPVSRFEYRNLGGNINYNTGLSTTTYDCGVGGMAGRDGDINENSDADIIQSYMYRSGGTWWIRADFHSHNNGESWDVDALCVQKWAPVTRYEFRNLGNNVNYNTFISSDTYECGVAGFAARDGDIEEHNTGDIIQAYLVKSGGTWWFRGDFRTHNDHESWDLDVLCLQR